MSELLNFTEAALKYIKSMMAESADQRGFRVSIKKTGCSGFSYAPTLIKQIVPGDLHWMAGDLAVYLDPACVDYVKGLTVDYIEEKKEGGLKQKKLIFVNPNEKSRCGCGESFHV